MCWLNISTHHLKPLLSKRSTDQITQVGVNLPNPLMAVNYVYNCDALPWSKSTIVIAGNSTITSINAKRFSTNFKSVEVCFSSATIDNI